MSISEKCIENEILAYLCNKKIFAWKNQSTGVFDPRRGIYRKSRNIYHINGVSDVLGILPDGRFLAIEVKKPYISRKNMRIKERTQEELEKLASEDQIKFVNKIRACGGVAFFADSLDVVDEQLKLYEIRV